jgi:hypothetical protein
VAMCIGALLQPCFHVLINIADNKLCHYVTGSGLVI